MEAAYSKATLASYRRRWGHLFEFIKALDLDQQLPVEQRTLALYIAYLHDGGAAYGTIVSAMSAIAWHHNMLGLKDCSKNMIIRKIIIGLKKSAREVKKAYPIGLDMLHECVDSLPKLEITPYERLLLSAVLYLGYHGCLRVGEMLVSTHDKNCVRFGDTGFTEDGNYLFTLHTFKHGKSPKNFVLYPAEDRNHCPVTALCRYYAHRPRTQGLVFVDVAGNSVDRKFLVTHLKQLLSLLGYDADRYNTHSLRVGRATDLALAGASETMIREVGRWNSNAYLGYVRFNLLHLPTS